MKHLKGNRRIRKDLFSKKKKKKNRSMNSKHKIIWLSHGGSDLDFSAVVKCLYLPFFFSMFMMSLRESEGLERQVKNCPTNRTTLLSGSPQAHVRILCHRQSSVLPCSTRGHSHRQPGCPAAQAASAKLPPPAAQPAPPFRAQGCRA